MEAATGFLALSLGLLQLHRYRRMCRPPALHHHTDNPLALLLAAHPLFRDTLAPHPLLFDSHLSLIPFVIAGLFCKAFPPYKLCSQEVVLSDGEVIVLDWVVTDGLVDASAGLLRSEARTPIVMIHPGAMGTSRDIPGQSYIAPALQRGWIVCVLNRRGHLRRLSRPRFNFFGAPSDIREVLQSIKAIRPNAVLFNVGLSVGSGLLVRHFGEEDNAFAAGVAVCPGYNIETCLGRIEKPYQHILLSSAKQYYLHKNKELLQDSPGYDACMQANDMQTFLDASHAMAGYASKEEYYAAHNPMRVLAGIDKPMLIINSKDGIHLLYTLERALNISRCMHVLDPICTYDNVLENAHLFPALRTAILAVTESGSHLPFYQGLALGCWAEEAAYAFFDCVLSGAELN